MSDKSNKLSSSLTPMSNDHFVSPPAKWRRDGPFIVDGTGRKVSLMQGEAAEHELSQRRIVAALNALRDTPTHFIEELLEQCDDNVISALIARDRKMAAILQRMDEKIAMHCREIEQLRETMEACRIFEERRALLQQAPGATEYEGLLRTLGIR
jgi:hypothetical protein